jgi:tannase/feruloyl esterase
MNLPTSSSRWTLLFSAIGAGVLAGGVLAAAPAAAALPNCTVGALNALDVPNLTVNTATDEPAASGVPEYCDLKGEVATNGEGGGPNTAGFEIDLPATWNQKFIFEGGGGFDGSLTHGTSQQLTKGYATASTDSGHTAPGPLYPAFNAGFAVISPSVPSEPKLVDYFYRARHQVAVAAKQLVLAYYGAKTIDHSYFTGCSNGGHEAIVEAIRYPNDFDGIISGDPWINQPGNEEWQLRNIKAFIKAWIPYSLGPAIDAAIYAQCDALDGVVDHLIQNPAKCGFNPDTLVPGILSEEQAKAVKLYLEAVRDQQGKVIFPGSTVSDIGEATPLVIPGFQVQGANTGIYGLELDTPAPDAFGPQPWGTLLASPANWTLAFGVIANLGYYDPSLNLISNLVVDDRGIVNDQANKLLYANLAPGLANRASMLLPFIGTGSKLLIYDGFSDPVLDPYETVRLYKDLVEQVGGYPEAQENVRLFMVPDMQHCAGGPGPNVFDTLTALENWVEGGQAPDGIIATHYVDNNPALGADRTMPLCKFPEQARYNGSGNVNDAASWTCPPQDQSLLEIGPNGRQAGLSSHDDNDR